MERHGLPASDDVCQAIREHRKPHVKKSSPESEVVAIAEDVATLVSNLVDGLQLPEVNDACGIYPRPVIQALMCEFPGEDDPRLWERS